MFRVNNGLSVQLISKNFILRRILAIVHIHQEQNFKINTEKYGKYSVSYLGHKIWNSIPQEIKNITTLAAFKTNITRLETYLFM